ncbi:MAG TPA: YraN family protein [Bacillota bacterium]|nr:YraN family protein [Bacillota bacterium]
MTTASTGQQAEAAAAVFLERKGCKVLARNWKTRMCEIDVIAERAGVVYFCEVKYRTHARQGSGLDYITSKKLTQMRFAAESWVHAHTYTGEYQLCAIEVSGPAFAITAVIKDL